MTIIPESKIQQDIVIYINNNFCLLKHEPRFIVYSVPNGIPIPIPIKERARALDLLHKTGMLNGVSDLIIQGVNGRILNVEVKAKTDQSPDQVKFQKRVEKLGGYYILVYSLDDFKRKFEQHIKWLKNEN
jgi:hypothetical protein